MKLKALGILSLAGILSFVAPADAANWGQIKGYVKVVNMIETGSSASTPAIEITFDRTGSFCDSTSGAATEVSDTIRINADESPVMFDTWVRAANAAYLSGKPLKVRTQAGCRTAYVVQCADLTC
jgi:hypothetical protein